MVDRPPDHLPRDVLERPDFIAACKAHELGDILAIANKQGGAGFTVSHIARRCEMTVGQVQAYIKDGRQAQSFGIFERVADGLHIPGRMLGMSRRPWEAEDEDAGNTRAALLLPRSDGSHITCGPDAGEDADIMLMLQEADRTDIGPGTIESLYTIFDKLCRDYPSAAAPELQGKLKRLYAQMMRLRQGRMTFAQHRELIALSGWVTALLACVDWDMNEREAAETARAATLRFGKEIGHAELTAWSYEMEAWFALTEGRFRDGTMIARDAQAIGGVNSAIVQLIMQEARGWARLGDRAEAESAIQRGHDLLQQLPAIHYPRHFIYDRTKFPFYAASCYQWLGDDTKAEEFANQVFKECKDNGTTERSPMRLADVHITLGLIQVRRGNLDAAFDAGSRALAYKRKSGPSLLIRAAELNAAMSRKFPNTRQAESFDAHLRAIQEEFHLLSPPNTSDA